MAKKAAAVKKASGSKVLFLKSTYDSYNGNSVKAFTHIKPVVRQTVIVENGKQVTDKTETVQPEAFYSSCTAFSGVWAKLVGEALPRNKSVEVTITWKEL